MAKRGTSKRSKANGAADNGTNGTRPEMGLIPEAQVASAPDGYEEVFGERVVGWWALTTVDTDGTPLAQANVIQGRLIDVFTTKSKFTTDGKKVYKVQLSAPTLVTSADEDEPGVLLMAPAGALVGIDEKGFLKSLSRLVVGQELWIAYRGKEAPSTDYPQGRHVFVGPYAKPAKVNPVTGEVRS